MKIANWKKTTQCLDLQTEGGKNMNLDKFPNRFEEAVKDVTFLSLEQWMMEKESLEPNSELNTWIRIWSVYKRKYERGENEETE